MGFILQKPSLLVNSLYPNCPAQGAHSTVSFAKYGARFLIRGGRFEAVEGAARSRNMVIEFPSYQAALECYCSPEYAAAMALRLDASEADILIIEGYDGVQPGEG
jgi:uncharacterized protein (DUF1330 family)